MYEKAGKDYQKIREKMEIEEDAAKIIQVNLKTFFEREE